MIGPTLGGYITDQYSWRWIFYINLPVGALAFLLCAALVHDPPYLEAERARLKKQAFSFDAIGLGLLVLMVVSWEILLSKGQEWDWLGDPFGRIQTLVTLYVGGLAGLVWWETRQARPVVNLRPLAERNFALCCVVIFCSYAVLYGSSTLLPGMLETLFGYDAFHAGLVQSPSGIFTILAIIVAGRLLGRGLDARWLIGAGLLVMAAGSWWMSVLNLEISPGQVVWPRVVLVLGLGIVFAPLNVAAYLYTPQNLRGAAVGLFALLRNEGGSFGTSLGQTLTERREQLHALRLNENLDRFNPAVASFLNQARPALMHQTGDPVAARRLRDLGVTVAQVSAFDGAEAAPLDKIQRHCPKLVALAQQPSESGDPENLASRAPGMLGDRPRLRRSLPRRERRIRFVRAHRELSPRLRALGEASGAGS